MRMFPCVEKAFAPMIFSAAAGLKNVILHFPGAITHRLSIHKPPICFHWCILMSYAVFEYFHALASPIRQDIIRGGAENRRFCAFLTLESEFLTTYEVSWPLHRRKLFIASRCIDSPLFEKFGYRKLQLQVEVCNEKINCLYKTFS